LEHDSDVTLSCEVYILIFNNAWASSVRVVVNMQDWHMLMVAVSILHQLKIFFFHWSDWKPFSIFKRFRTRCAQV